MGRAAGGCLHHKTLHRRARHRDVEETTRAVSFEASGGKKGSRWLEKSKLLNAHGV